MGPVLLSLLKPVADLAANYTSTLATTIDTNLNATMTSRASQTTADTINTNTATTVGRITAARMTHLDEISTRVPGVEDTLSDTGSSDGGIGIVTGNLSDQTHSATVTISSSGVWYTAIEESQGTSGVIEFLAMRSSSSSAHSLDGVFWNDWDERRWYRTGMTSASTELFPIVGSVSGGTDDTITLGNVVFNDGFKFNVRNSSTTTDAVVYWRYFRTS